MKRKHSSIYWAVEIAVQYLSVMALCDCYRLSKPWISPQFYFHSKECRYQQITPIVSVYVLNTVPFLKYGKESRQSEISLSKWGRGQDIAKIFVATMDFLSCNLIDTFHTIRKIPPLLPFFGNLIKINFWWHITEVIYWAERREKLNYPCTLCLPNSTIQ